MAILQFKDQDPPAPRSCENCAYRMASETAVTGMRCGHDYFQTPRLLRKFKTMSQYPVVRRFTLCESWREGDPEKEP